MYEVYLGTMLCPIAPSKLKTKIKGQNKTINLINDGEINMLKQAGLTEVSFDLLLPNVKYPFARYKSGFENAKYFLDILEELKLSRKPFFFKVTRTFPNGTVLYDTEDMKVSLEDYEITEDVKNGFDVSVSIKLKQYKDYGTKLVEITEDENSETTASVKETRSTENSPEPTSNQSYTVVKGDNLWNIAKKHYGNGSKYTIILNANKDKIKSPNLIYPGQVLTIPPSDTPPSTYSKSGGKKSTSKSKSSNSGTGSSSSLVGGGQHSGGGTGGGSR